ncbi:MAG TPA: hypothetical protein PLC24_09490 [Myxococcota bacterium]|nr:hypothetical protein [Myxococcota bacterium]HPV04779.1 hypothetical protein [Myxococcota bacterium]
MRFCHWAFIPCVVTLLGVGCGLDNEVDWSGRTTGMVVSLTSAGGNPYEGEQQILPLPASGSANGIDIEVDIDVLAAAEGSQVLQQDIWVRMSVRPGKLLVVSADRYVGNDVFLEKGHASNVKVRVWDVFGPTRVWAEDVGYLPRTRIGVTPSCGDGKDNDGDGFTDWPLDPGCLEASDDSEESGSGAAGVSRTVMFDTPTIAQLQGFYAGVTTDFNGASPYAGEEVTVDKGDLVVTRVTTDGMYVTDASDQGGYNHLFVFTYNSPTTVPVCEADEQDNLGCVNDGRPVPVRICDRLTFVGGSVSEFYGFTEMSFPVWDTQVWKESDGPCPMPAPRALMAADFRGKALEGSEAGLVTVSDIVLGSADDIVDCDFNKDGTVDFRDYDTNECSDECSCREQCDKDLLCVEFNQYVEFGQWPARLGGESGVKVWINSRESVPEFDPWAEDVPRQLVAITGTLRNLSFLDPYPWIIEPRCQDDIVLTGEPKPITQACVGSQDGE